MALPKYNSAEHKRRVRDYTKQIADGNGWCTETICVMPTRYIPPGTPRSGWHVPHTEDGVTYRDGPAHAKCNTADGGRRSHQQREPRRWKL